MSENVGLGKNYVDDGVVSVDILCRLKTRGDKSAPRC